MLKKKIRYKFHKANAKEEENEQEKMAEISDQRTPSYYQTKDKHNSFLSEVNSRMIRPRQLPPINQ